MMTSPKQTSLFTEEKSTSSQVDSLVSHIPMQESEKAKRMRDISGRRCLEQYGRFNHPTSWGRMFPALLIGMEGWSSMRCKMSWKLKATRSHRFFFQLQVSTLPTRENEFGLLPTPRVSGEEGYETRAKRKGHIMAMSYLESHIDYLSINGLLPTPTSGADRNTNYAQGGKCLKTGLMEMGFLPTPIKNITNASADINLNMNLENMDAQIVVENLRQNLLPTPATRDYKGENSMDHLTRKHKSEGNSHHDQLPNYIKLATGKTSQLNPRFVMEMMGFPPDWTELPFLNGETNQ